MTALLAATVFGCTRSPPGAQSGVSGTGSGHSGVSATVDFEATCAGVWPVDACAEGDCTPLPVNDRYVDAWFEVFTERSGWSPEEVDEHVRMRVVDHRAATQSSAHLLTVQITIGWVPFLFVDQASALGADPTFDEVLEAWRHDPQLGGVDVPVVGPSTPLALGPGDVQRAVTDCGATLGTTFDPTGFCSARASFRTRGRSDEPYLGFDFLGPTGGRRIPHLTVDVIGGEVSCALSAAYTP